MNATDFFQHFVQVEWDMYEAFANVDDAAVQNTMYNETLRRIRKNGIQPNLQRMEGVEKLGDAMMRGASIRHLYAVAEHGDSVAIAYVSTHATFGPPALKNRLIATLVDSDWAVVSAQIVCPTCKGDGRKCASCGGSGFDLTEGDLPKPMPTATAFTVLEDPPHPRTLKLWTRLKDSHGAVD